MKVVICGSMVNFGKMAILKSQLEQNGHKVIIPEPACCAHIKQIDSGKYVDTFRLKKKYDYIRKHFKNIKNCDCVVVANFDKNGIRNYIGGNAFLEMGFDHIFNKPIFLVNPLPENEYCSHEMKAMSPVILKKSFSNLELN